MAKCLAVVVVVPLFVDHEARPDFGWMENATRSLSEHLTSGTLISYETTLPVGTTRTRWKPMIEESSGLTEGEDFHLIFSPERVLTGRVFEDLRKYPKLVGGLSPRGAAKAVDFYNAVLDFDQRETKTQSYQYTPGTPPISSQTANESYSGTGSVPGGVVGTGSTTAVTTGTGTGTTPTTAPNSYSKSSSTTNNAVGSTVETRTGAELTLDLGDVRHAIIRSGSTRGTALVAGQFGRDSSSCTFSLR